MRQIFSAILLMFILCLCAEAQFAADYLKPSPGSTWKYQRYDLDSVQQIIAASKRIVTDSLTGTVTKKAITGYVLKSRNSPLRDSTIVSLNNDVISYYNGGYPVEGLSRAADSLGLGFIPQALNWYPYQKFNSPPLNNRVDTLFRRDSTIFVDSVEFPLTLVITRLRRPAGVVSVPAGTFISAVPFEITMNVDTWIFTPLGRFAVPLLKLTDTLFVAKNNWIVKEIQGSTYFPLTAIDNDSVPHFKIPGYVRLLELQTLTAVDREPAAPLSLTIGQNFPNPFNGTTMIPLAASTRTALTIEVFDLLGRFVDTVTDGIVDPGEYQFQWNSGSRPSGLYLCWISANGRTTVKKMLLQK